MNEWLWLGYLILDFSYCILMIRAFGQYGLYAIIINSLIICNMQVLKLVDLFGITVSVGNISYASIFIATDLLSEVYGSREARKGVLIGLCCLLFFTIAIQSTIAFAPNQYDTSHGFMRDLFALSPRIVAASIITYIVAQLFDIYIFDFLKSYTQSKHLWLRNNISTCMSQAMDSFLFVFVAFYGVYSLDVLISIALSTLTLKWTVALLDTPVVYFGRSILYKYHIMQDCDDDTQSMVPGAGLEPARSLSSEGF